MRGSVSHQTGQLQSNGVKLLMCYISLVQELLIQYVSPARQTTAECCLFGSNSACSSIYEVLCTTTDRSRLQVTTSQPLVAPKGRLHRTTELFTGVLVIIRGYFLHTNSLPEIEKRRNNLHILCGRKCPCRKLQVFRVLVDTNYFSL